VSTRDDLAAVERSWREVAVKFRRALEILDWPVPRCLPGEHLECGGSEAEHAAGYLGVLAAVVEFKRAHLHLTGGGADISAVVYESTRDELAAIEAARPCGRGEH
jgi:hypothetical protein